MPFKYHVFTPICIKNQKPKKGWALIKRTVFCYNEHTHDAQTPIQNGEARANTLSVHQRNGFFHQKLGK